MGIPYQLQLAHGWTVLTIKINVAAVILLIPAIFVVVPKYGAVGAAWIWVLLNFGYLVIDIYFMHRRLLHTEKWRWYGQDLALPLIAATTVALLCRYVMPTGISRLLEFGMLLLAAGCAVLTAALVCPLLRPQLAKHVQAAVQHVLART